MANYSNHSKFLYKKYSEIQAGIESGEINSYDIVYTKDTHENVIVTGDKSVISVRSRIYRFIDAQTAEKYLNAAPDTYEGQIVAIYYRDRYVGYIVNRRSNGEYYVTSLSEKDGELDYDVLQHRPINNYYGTMDNPIMLGTLPDGIFKVTGQYKISDKYDTTFVSASSNLFLVQHTPDETHVKRIAANDITDYVINQSGNVNVAVVPTTDWLKSQGYVTEPYINAKLAALDYINKKDIEDYVSGVVMQTIDETIGERINVAIEKKLNYATEADALDVFAQIFK